MGQTKLKTVEEVEEIEQTPAEESVIEAAEEEVETPQATEDKEPTKKVKKSKKPGKARGRGKKYQEAVKLVDRDQKYPLEEAVKLAQQASYSKFTGTLEAHINTAVKNLRGLASMPHLSGKSLRILAFGTGAKEAGADIEGTEETLNEIDKGKINFDVVITTPQWMPKLAKAARILGPRGLMPNPKSGTITDNLEKAITELRAGKVEYKTEPNGKVIHLAVGKSDQAPEEVGVNIRSLYNTLGKSKVRQITLASTMGPGVKVDLKSF